MKIFDAHTHVSSWSEVAVKTIQRAGISDLCNISYPRDGSLDHQLQQYEQQLFETENCCNVRIHRVFSLPFSIIQQSEERFIESALRKISSLKDQGNVVGIKIWKDVGMEIRKPNGRPLTIDSPVLDPIFSALAETRLVCIVHTGDPLIAWTQEARNYQYYRLNPRFNMFERPDFPLLDELIERFERLITRWREISFVAAHFASLDHAPLSLGRMMRRNSNLFVDSAGRHSFHLRNFGESFLSLLDAFPNRIIYGTDLTIERLTERSEMFAAVERRQGRIKEIQNILGETEVAEQYFWKNASRLFLRHEHV